MIKVKKGSNVMKDFKIGKYPVTQKKFKKMMGFNPSYFKGEDLPVESVTWYDAVMYCNKLSEKKGVEKYYTIENKTTYGDSIIEADVTIVGGYGYRLPTDEEWVWAATGGKQSKGYIYSGSNNADEVAWYYSNSECKTHPVGQKKPNELGLYDMSGNVWEWNESGEDSDRYVRGGSWYSNDSNCEVVDQCDVSVDIRNNYLGFRVCRSIGGE